MFFYVFSSGSHEDYEEIVYVHERQMTDKEVLSLLREKWPKVRETCLSLFQRRRQRAVEIFGEENLNRLGEPKVHVDLQAFDEWDREFPDPSPRNALIKACGFKELETSASFHWGESFCFDRVEEIDEALK